tara:strand:+ start:124 stop:498 length:375 start_codon:yes stop_codon:yes gene_type:complete
MAWEDIVKMKDLAEMINVDKDKSLFDGPEKDRLNRFLQDSDLSKNFTLVDYTIALTNLSILAKKPEARISDNLRSKIQIVYKRFNVFSESMFALADDLKKELEDLYDLDRVAQGKMTMRDFDEG